MKKIQSSGSVHRTPGSPAVFGTTSALSCKEKTFYLVKKKQRKCRMKFTPTDEMQANISHLFFSWGQYYTLNTVTYIFSKYDLFNCKSNLLILQSNVTRRCREFLHLLSLNHRQNLTLTSCTLII